MKFDLELFEQVKKDLERHHAEVILVVTPRGDEVDYIITATFPG